MCEPHSISQRSQFSLHNEKSQNPNFQNPNLVYNSSLQFSNLQSLISSLQPPASNV
jgi:hypothetical protein